jgi:hypothetical protein
MIVEKISEKSVRLKVENENNKIANKLKTIFFEDGCIPISELEDYEEVPYAIWCNYIPELVPPTEVDKLYKEISKLKIEAQTLKEEAVRLKNENTLLAELLLENDYRLSQEMSLLKQSNEV